MTVYRMQISEDAYKYLQSEVVAFLDDGSWENVRGVDGSLARVGKTAKEALFDTWKQRLEAGQFEYVIPDE